MTLSPLGALNRQLNATFKHTIFLLALLLTFAARPMRSQTCANADLIVRNAKIVTMDSFDRIAEAMAVRDGRISAVGTSQEIASCASPATRVFDAQSRTILPGLIDVHTHAMEWAKSIVSHRIDATYPGMKSIA